MGEDMEEMGIDEFARSEKRRLRILQKAHQYLKDQGEPILVVSLADLLWNPMRNKRRLEQYMPCLGELDPNFVPKNGTDIFPGNHWKAEGSVTSYGARTDPTGAYDRESGLCETEADILTVLPDDEHKIAADAVEYLQSYS